MIDLLTVIYNKLKPIQSKTYFEKAKDTTKFPYVVFNLPTSNETEGREDFFCDIDIWDNQGNDTTRLETLTNSIDKEMQRLKYIDENLQFSVYRISRLIVTDPDEKIRRRQLRYLIKTYFIGE